MESSVTNLHIIGHRKCYGFVFHLISENLLCSNDFTSNSRDIFCENNCSYGSHTLREKCRYSEFFWSVFSCIRTENGEIHPHTCAYQGVRNISFAETFVYVLTGWPLLSLFPTSITAICFSTSYDFARETLDILSSQTLNHGPEFWWQK